MSPRRFDCFVGVRSSRGLTSPQRSNGRNNGAAVPFPGTGPAIRQAKELEPAGIRMMRAP
jgi:hypothetical protein